METGLGLSRRSGSERLDLSFINRQTWHQTGRRTEPFDEPQSEIGRSPYVLALSRIHPKKGFELLIESFAALKKAGCSAPGVWSSRATATRGTWISSRLWRAGEG